ncbi:MAG: O-antigen ligase family protein [Propionibacterium sp.]|nr:O-antigen ligase family protein [Propionibacterium sp.]MDN6794366.1 O-antigen ligase family protein [Propionibacterium sp.]
MTQVAPAGYGTTRLQRLVPALREHWALSMARVSETVEVGSLPLTLLWERFRDVLTRKLGGHAESLLPPLAAWVFFVAFAGQGLRDLMGWGWFGVLTLVSALAFTMVFIAAGRRVGLRRLPGPIVAYAAVCCASVLWSQYRVETIAASLIMVLTTVMGVMLAVAFPLRSMMGALTRALQWTLGISLALELFVAVVIGHRIPPLYMLGWDHVPDSYYWVNGLLLQGGPIQGFVANRNPLAFIALLTMLCVVVLHLDARMSLARTTLWVGLSVLTLALTRSATVTVATLACMSVLVVALVLRSLPVQRRRSAVHIAVALGVAAALSALAMHTQVSDLLGRDPDMTGRAEIWDRVLRLWSMHPLTGWGWIMYWVPWIPMFRYLVVRPDGTPTMQAHNAYVEALFQTGLIGALVLVVAVVWVLHAVLRTALRDLDRDILSLLPALLMTAMFVQSFTESRLLSEGNWLLFVALGTWLTVRANMPGMMLDAEVPERHPSRSTRGELVVAGSR